MKLGLILATNIKLNPYIEIFRKVLDEHGIDYEIISWDRESLGEEDGIVFKYPAPNKRGKIGKFIDYYKFSSFAKKIITHRKYDKLIVFGAAIGVFMYDFLNKSYSKNFWLDYRDLTIEQQFMGRFKKLCDISSYISISSPGFKEVFPAQYDFILSHNFDIDEARVTLKQNVGYKRVSNPIVVSTIGSIRDYGVSIDIIDSLKNKSDFTVNFIGKGPSAEALMQYVKDNDISNVKFSGFYLKKDEGKFYDVADMINIYLPRIPSHSTPMANRFYKALMFRKPMIVTNRSTQGDYVEKYQLGLSIEDCSNLPDQIRKYINTLDGEAFVERCNDLLKEFVTDYNNFYAKLVNFIRNE